VTRGSKRSLAGIVARRPLPRFLALALRRVTVAAPILGSSTFSFFSLGFRPFLPLSIPFSFFYDAASARSPSFRLCESFFFHPVKLR